MQTQIKICGLKDEASIDAAAKAGATHVGLVHFEKSPRHVAFDQAAALRMRAPASLKVVLLLVNAEPGLTAKAIEVVKPDIVQFHGSETAQWLRELKSAVDIEIWKA
jgi:phosphoribosylanthranilate isomerase